MADKAAEMKTRGRWTIMPPTWFFLMILLMVALNFTVPGPRLLPGPFILVGIFPLGLGMLISGLAAGQFFRAGTTVKPFLESSHLVTTGMFGLTRNPMYLGLLISLAGIAMLLGSATPWIGVAIFAILIDRMFIAREEPMMRARFGKEFDAYKSRVRRWI